MSLCDLALWAKSWARVLQKMLVQKMCAPVNIFATLRGFWAQANGLIIMSLGAKVFFWGGKHNSEVKNIFWGPKYLWVLYIFRSKTFFGFKIFFGPKIFIGSKIYVGSKIFVGQKYFLSKKYLLDEKFFIQNIFRSKIVFRFKIVLG